MKKSEVEQDADPEADRGVHGRAQERIESEPQVQEVRPIGSEHDEFPVCDVHDLRDAPDEVEAVRDDREDAAEEHAEGEVRDEHRRFGHSPAPPPQDQDPVYGYCTEACATSAGYTTFSVPACHCTRIIECAICSPDDAIWNCPKKFMMCMVPRAARTS